MSDETLNWESLAQTSVGDVERPPLRPVGHYVALFAGRAEQGASSKKGTLFLKYPTTVQSALDDVDVAELEAAGGASFKGEVVFWISPNALWRFTDFAKGMGASDEMNVLEAAEYLAGCGEPFVVEARHEENDKNPGNFFLRLDNPIPLSVWEERQRAG